MIVMVSGGARARSGPAPDPSALRRDRKDDAEWTILPREGYQGVIPEFPLADALSVEVAYWEQLWRKPQGVQWAKMDVSAQLARYVRAYVKATAIDARPTWDAGVSRMETDLGVSITGMHGWRWKFSEDELAKKRDVPVRAVGRSARDRLASGG